MPKSEGKNTKGKDQTEVAIRDGFGEGLLEVARKNSKVLALSADLTESVRMQEFAKEFPDRFWQVGIAEQNMAGISAGLALEGFIPYMGSFASFQPYRNLDHIRTSICIQNANVKIISSHAGFSYGGDGIQIQALEDVAIMRALPNMTVLVPADADQAKHAAIAAADISGPVYVRLGREKTKLLSTYLDIDKEELDFRVGKVQRLRTGTDITLISTGYMVGQCLEVASQLAAAGIYATVLNVHTIKPLDLDAIVEAVQVSKKVLVVEEHQRFGGIGELVAAELLHAGLQPKFDIVAVDDKFGDTAADTKTLWQKHGLDVPSILNKAMRLIN